MSQSKIKQITDEYQDVFQPVTECLPHRFNVDHTIKLVEGATSTFRKPYCMTKEEEQEVQKQKEAALAKGLISQIVH